MIAFTITPLIKNSPITCSSSPFHSLLHCSNMIISLQNPISPSPLSTPSSTSHFPSTHPSPPLPSLYLLPHPPIPFPLLTNFSSIMFHLPAHQLLPHSLFLPFSHRRGTRVCMSVRSPRRLLSRTLSTSPSSVSVFVCVC